MAVSKTTNGGVTWQRSFPTATSGFCYALAIDPMSTNTIYAGGMPGVFKSTDAGITWSSSSIGLYGDISALAIDPLNTNTIYAGSSYGVFKSTDGGASWMNTGIISVRAVALYPGAPDTVFAATAAGVYRSNTAGGNWMQINTGLGSMNTASLGFNPGNYLFCGTKGAGIYRLDLSTGVAENNGYVRTAQTMVHPNPFRSNLEIWCNADENTKEVRIYDASGRMVQSFILGSLSLTKRIVWQGDDHTGKQVPAGVYFIEFSGLDNTPVHKVLKID